ncbi:E3 ubiquitin-protein ligase TRIM39-like [Bufo gargarizans]|uniref:E3 ubiquitin-protein ligase TRIM39-like n=1 Tax=Bufo gargarizans TaxID=30331 RepID=UPI001CF43305|nr:E3 ubiquitin-protein ligase TRIM39-like [Bufo gargarizans]
MSSAVLSDEPACMDTNKEPSLLRRGHSFSRECINRDPEMQVGSECKTRSNSLPRKKKPLCNFIHCFLCAQTDEETPSIVCTNFTQFPVPDSRTCLHCKASLCKDHLRDHTKFLEHILSNSRRSSVHKKKLEYYYVGEDAYLCVLCFNSLHMEHQMDSLEETSKKKNDLKNLSSSSKPEDEENRLEANVLSKKINMVFEVLKMKVLNLISRQAVQASVPCYDEIQELKAKKEESSGKMSTNEDPVTVLEGLKPEVVRGGNHREINEDNCRDVHVLDEGSTGEILHTGFSDLVTIAFKELYKYEVPEILLDEDTAGSNVQLLPDMKSFYWEEIHKPKSKNQQRFRDHQVLSSCSFSTGRHFWSVETSKWGNWRLGMSFPSIARKGFRSYIGCNKKSWGLCKWNNQYSVMHACKEIKLPGQMTCHCFGVYLDYEAGHLSFYELSDPIRHLYTFTTTFTEPLHAIFRLWLDAHGGAWMILNKRGPSRKPPCQ